MNPVEKEELVRALARAIDPDEPPGMAAGVLARELVTLVQGIGGQGAAALTPKIRELVKRPATQRIHEMTCPANAMGMMFETSPPCTCYSRSK